MLTSIFITASLLIPNILASPHLGHPHHTRKSSIHHQNIANYKTRDLPPFQELIEISHLERRADCQDKSPSFCRTVKELNMSTNGPNMCRNSALQAQMMNSCAKSCGFCNCPQDTATNCKQDAVYCVVPGYSEMMRAKCPFTCGICNVKN